MLYAILLQVLTPLQDTTVEETYWFPHLGVSVQETRWLDRAAGTIERAALLPDGSLVDIDALWREEQRLRFDAQGNISPELQRAIDQAAPGETVHVAFWLRAEDAPDFRLVLNDAERAGMSGEDARRHAHASAVAFLHERNADFAARLTAAGHEVTSVADAWPNVFARIPAEQIARWSTDGAVDRAYASSDYWYPELDNAQGTMRTPTVWARGVSGSGSPVKIMINDPDHVDTGNPYLPTIVKSNSGGSGYHATAVAGNIAFNHSTYKGAMHGVGKLYSADGSGDSGAPTSWSWGIGQGISFGNCSWWNGYKGSIVYLDRFFDYTIRNYGVMMFKSTGNQGETSTPYTTSPGNGYNSTNSGAYSDKNNIDWSGDSMASYSSYWDPVEGHEKPEVANAGEDVDTASYSAPWVYYDFGGTSSASPLTCGVAGLLASRDTALMTRPEAVKAILMVSAWHNVEGNAVLSEKDGAGAVHASAADAVVRDGQYAATTLSSSSFDASGHYETTFPAYAGDDTRVIGLWFSKANSSYSTDRLEMDLDLVILDPSGNTVASSSNSKNAFEILSFIPGVSGTHTARFVRQRFDGSSEPFAFAWSSRMDVSVAELTVTGTPRLGQTVTLGFYEPYDPGVWFQAFASAGTLPMTYDLGTGWALPLQLDKVLLASATRPELTGTLGPSGAAVSLLRIPNAPALANRQVYMAMYTATGPLGPVRGSSEAISLTILP